MADRNLRTIIWAIVIVILIVSIAALVFIVVWIPSREGGSGVRVAVLDSGINMDVRIAGYKVSRELKDKVMMQESFVTTEYGYSTNASWVDDTEYYHGTLVALQIASRSFGIAPEAELVIAKCADSTGLSTYPALLAAFNWAVKTAKADIINISIGGPLISNNSIVDAINKAALEEGVLTVISSGNSGDASGYSLTSIEGPADALQAIAVGASVSDGVADYSSIGPMKDHSIKPDLVDSGFTLIAVGTSFAAPKVAAKAAVLMSWCKAQGYNTSPGLLKAALMSTADPIDSYPYYVSGTGIANVEEAKTHITSVSKVSNWPLASFIYPDNLPFGLVRAFQGDVWSFPLQIITPVEQVFNFSSDLTPSESIIEIADSVTINQTGLVQCKLVIPQAHPIGIHQETLIIESSLGESFGVPINIAIEAPDIRLGFDVYHSLWDIDHLLGQFHELTLLLSNQDVALIELDHYDNFSNLADFDALIIPDPNTYGIILDEEAEIHTFSRNFTSETINNIANYVDSGHGLFFLGTTNDSANFTETNQFLNEFNVSITNDTIPSGITFNELTGEFNIVRITEMNSTHPVTSTVVNFDYLGSKLEIIGDNVENLAWYSQTSNIVLAAYTSASNPLGRAVFTGSNFMADNWGINNEYNATGNLGFIINVIEWITNTTVLTMQTQSNNIALTMNQPIVNQMSINSLSSNGLVTTIFGQLDIPNIITVDQRRRK
jgi:hypothetical protein